MAIRAVNTFESSLYSVN